MTDDPAGRSHAVLAEDVAAIAEALVMLSADEPAATLVEAARRLDALPASTTPRGPEHLVLDAENPEAVDDLVLRGVDIHLEVLATGLAHLRITRGSTALALDLDAHNGRLVLRIADEEGGGFVEAET
ncbi:hypothetical protein EV383_4433 [Pseudonocardia sediminis]|uniref:Uncharacterized protein n=1 Tax=Pseudonocardia sediminis TaxID=1397368 RepID=A0A4Q7V221_PSEST|nr:hypothetical protein [Pseudonocardia sediminis]RZT87508.1 hypothetical protein EV383_4433 [Pseudonocardia sediminis]